MRNYTEFEEKIGFKYIRTKVTESCESESGREEARRMSFLTGYARVKRELQRVDEMVKVLSCGSSVPGPPMPEVRAFLTEARVDGSYVSAENMLKLKNLLSGFKEVRDFFCVTDGERVYPRLAECFEEMSLFPELIDSIEGVINRFGEVKDNASPRLADITRDIARTSAAMSSAMQAVIAKAASQGVVDRDTVPVMRDGRLVIPVSSTSKREIPGIVHDVSATGKTSYIEPGEVVRAGNKLRQLEIERSREIVLILTNLTDLIRPEIDAILSSARLIGLFDFIRAKARVAISTDAQMPVIEKSPELDWFHAVHPTLAAALKQQGREVVPLTLKMDREHRALVISGPNAGGKSVCLKTIGVVQYMMQCGLLPTLYSNSHMGLFDEIFIDIGDQQSIENDLSTYSSHLRNMKLFMAKAGESSLVLIDEIGSGTEPIMGGALAQAVLAKLGLSNCFIVATTHYQNLKTFADREPGFVNASMLYDRQHLRPLFQLSVGHPGSSFALEIARGTGLPNDVIEQAKEIAGSDYVDMDKYLLDIARDRRYWSNKRRDIREKEGKIDRILEQYEEKARELNENRKVLLKQARQEAREIVEGANARIERTIHEIKKAEAEKERTREIRAQLEAYKKEVAADHDDKAVAESLAKGRKKKAHKKREAEQPKTDAIAVGDFVKMADGGTVSGKVTSIEGKKAFVEFGALRSSVPLDKLIKTSKPGPTAASKTRVVSASTNDSSRQRQLNFSTEIDLRGMRADEALQAVTYFLDDAIQFSAHRLRILHGTGTGALRVAVRQLLDSYPGVENYHDEDVRFGGAGITVVNLK